MTHRLQWSPSRSYFHGSETPEEKLPLGTTLGRYFTRQPKHMLEGIAAASSGKKMRHRSDRDTRKKVYCWPTSLCSIIPRQRLLFGYFSPFS